MAKGEEFACHGKGNRVGESPSCDLASVRDLKPNITENQNDEIMPCLHDF
jgi:hypothetical protein